MDSPPAEVPGSPPSAQSPLPVRKPAREAAAAVAHDRSGSIASAESDFGTVPGAVRWYEEQVRPHHSALRAWLKARFPWLVEIDDIVQEACYRLWRRRQRSRESSPRSPKALLFTIARNAVCDLARRRAVVVIDSVADPARLPVLDSTDVVETVCTRQELELLADALRSLPARGRQVLTLTKIYGLTEREVAEQLGLSEHTVRTHVVRSLARCHEYLSARGVGPR